MYLQRDPAPAGGTRSETPRACPGACPFHVPARPSARPYLGWSRPAECVHVPECAYRPGECVREVSRPAECAHEVACTREGEYQQQSARARPIECAHVAARPAECAHRPDGCVSRPVECARERARPQQSARARPNREPSEHGPGWGDML